MKIIALWEQGRRGKSTTLKMLLVKVLERIEKYKILYCSRNVNLKQINAELEKERSCRNQGKKCGVENIIIVLSINDRVIGICTAGDNEDQLKKAFAIFDLHNSQLCICASRSKGGTVSFLNRLKDMGNELEWMQKASITGYKGLVRINEMIDDLNNQQSEILFEKIFD